MSSRKSYKTCEAWSFYFWFGLAKLDCCVSSVSCRCRIHGCKWVIYMCGHVKLLSIRMRVCNIVICLSSLNIYISVSMHGVTWDEINIELV